LKQTIVPTVDNEIVTGVFTADINNDNKNDIFIVVKNTVTNRVSFKIALQKLTVGTFPGKS
jgi:hypothetical protein